MAISQPNKRKITTALSELDLPPRGTEMEPKEQYELVCSKQFRDIKTSLRKIEREQKAQSKSLAEVREKVFDGFDTRIDAVDKDVEQLRRDNETDHKEIKGTLKSLVVVLISGLMMIIAAILINIFVFNPKANIEKQLKPIIEMLEERINETDNQGP